MKNRRIIAVILVVILALAACAAYAQSTTDETVLTPEQEAENQQEELRKAFLSNFTTTDLNGETIDQSLFAEYDLTMINIWATFCPPCIKEMPELGKLSQDYKDKGVQIIGVISDAANYDGSISEDQVALAKEIVATTKADYPHLLPSTDLINILLWQIDAVPTTIFVDSQGGLVGYAYTGAADYDTWVQRIEDTLGQL